MRTIFASIILLLSATLLLHARSNEPFSYSPYVYSDNEFHYQPYWGYGSDYSLSSPYTSSSSEDVFYEPFSESASLRSTVNGWLDIPYGDVSNALKMPVGGGGWGMLFVLMIYAFVIYFRRRKINVNSM